MKRIPRYAEDRIARETTPLRRYCCPAPHGCGWEGTLPVTSNDIVIDAREFERARVQMPRTAESCFVLWALIGIVTVALGAIGVKLYDSFDPRSLLEESTPTVPLGVSDFGRPLPGSDPVLSDREPAQRAGNTAAARITTPAPGGDGAPLALRTDCAWGEPGRNPYTGTVQQALTAAHLPADVVARLERKIRDHETSDRLVIRNDTIRAAQSGAAFEPRAIKMTYGKTLCLNSRVNFKRGHMERADLYEVVDARGVTYSVMVPYACGNISLLGPRTEKPMGALPQSGGGGQGLYRSAPFSTPFDDNTVPEPETWTLMAGAIALLAWLIRPR